MNWFRRKGKIQTLSPLEGYNKWAASYHDENNPVKNFSDTLVMDFLPDLRDKSILDIGCGTGKFCSVARKQNASRIVGIDISPAMLAVAREQCPGTEFRCGDIASLTLEEGSFDVIISALVMGHIEHLEPALQKLLKALKPGGAIIITDFHPFLTLLNSKRTFLDPVSRKHFEVKHHLHLFERYFRVFEQQQATLEKFEEPQFNQTPVVFGLRARKI